MRFNLQKGFPLVTTKSLHIPSIVHELLWFLSGNTNIKYLNDNYTNLVFILWGNDAKKKASSVDRSKHYVLESAHPSPFSVKKFYGNMHFSKTNNYLKASNKTIIDWTVY